MKKRAGVHLDSQGELQNTSKPGNVASFQACDAKQTAVNVNICFFSYSLDVPDAKDIPCTARAQKRKVERARIRDNPSYKLYRA
jgi:hypothetical protein